MDFLTRILEHKHEEVRRARVAKGEGELRAKAEARDDFRGFLAALSKPGPDNANIIAEIKRASPSKGPIRPDMDPAQQAQAYQRGGARALSVLTDAEFFSGSAEDLQAARRAIDLPVLRKDFIVAEYQIYEAAAMGADATLLIVRAVSYEFLKAALELCSSIGLDALVEVHDDAELDTALKAGARLVGINNRNLATFVTDLQTTVDLAANLPDGAVAVGESGIRGRDDIVRLNRAGVFNFLIGESLVRADDPAVLLAELMGRTT